MVRGNWERRAEMGNIRRERAKERKRERRENAKIPNAEAVIRFLSTDTNLTNVTSNAKMEGWLDPLENEGFLVCQRWFRNDSCSTKKCRLFHADDNDDNISISHLRCLTVVSDDTYHGQELSILPPRLLADISPSEYPRIRFIAVDNRLIYDKTNAQVWIDWYSSVTNNNTATNNRKLDTLREHYNDEDSDNSDNSDSDDNDNNDYDGADDKENDNKVNDSNIINDLDGIALNFNNDDSNDDNNDRLSLASLLLYPKVLSKIIELAPFHDLTQLYRCSKHIKKNISSSHDYQKKKKETASLLAAEISRKKKEEQRKKIKNAHKKKVDKKDSYSRGRVRT